jgi:hypothetical protein
LEVQYSKYHGGGLGFGVTYVEREPVLVLVVCVVVEAAVVHLVLELRRCVLEHELHLGADGEEEEAPEDAPGVKETEGPPALGEEAVAVVDEGDLPVAAGVEEAVVEPEASPVSGEKVRAAPREEAVTVVVPEVAAPGEDEHDATTLADVTWQNRLKKLRTTADEVVIPAAEYALRLRAQYVKTKPWDSVGGVALVEEEALTEAEAAALTSSVEEAVVDEGVEEEPAARAQQGGEGSRGRSSGVGAQARDGGVEPAGGAAEVPEPADPSDAGAAEGSARGEEQEDLEVGVKAPEASVEEAKAAEAEEAIAKLAGGLTAAQAKDQSASVLQTAGEKVKQAASATSDAAEKTKDTTGKASQVQEAVAETKGTLVERLQLLENRFTADMESNAKALSIIQSKLAHIDTS